MIYYITDSNLMRKLLIRESDGNINSVNLIDGGPLKIAAAASGLFMDANIQPYDIVCFVLMNCVTAVNEKTIKQVNGFTYQKNQYFPEMIFNFGFSEILNGDADSALSERLAAFYEAGILYFDAARMFFFLSPSLEKTKNFFETSDYVYGTNKVPLSEEIEKLDRKAMEISLYMEKAIDEKKDLMLVKTDAELIDNMVKNLHLSVSMTHTLKKLAAYLKITRKDYRTLLREYNKPAESKNAGKKVLADLLKAATEERYGND